MNVRIHNQDQSISVASKFKAGIASSDSGTSQSASSNLTAADEPLDTASLSSTSGQITDDNQLRQDRINALRAQVQSGTYVVNAHDLASAMYGHIFRH